MILRRKRGKKEVTTDKIAQKEENVLPVTIGCRLTMADDVQPNFSLLRHQVLPSPSPTRQLHSCKFVAKFHNSSNMSVSRVTSKAYCKLILHACKHPSRPILGLLLVPLFHISLAKRSLNGFAW